MEEELFPDAECIQREGDNESFIEFLSKVGEADPHFNDLYKKWELLCSDHNINLHFVRSVMDSWFQECYQSRKDVHKLTAHVSCEMAERRMHELLEKFYAEMQAHAHQCKDIVRKLGIQNEVDNVRNMYPGCWVNSAIQCVEKENELMADFKKKRYEAATKEETQKMEANIHETGSLCAKISQKIVSFSNEVNNNQRYRQLYEEKNEIICNLEAVLAKKNQKSGPTKKLTDLQQELQQLQTKIGNTSTSILACIVELNDLFSETHTKFATLIKELINHVEVWKKEFQFVYAELAGYPCLERIAPWCAEVGKQLYDMLYDILPQYQNSIQSLSDMTPEDDANVDCLIKCYKELLQFLLQETFVVTEQEHYIIKVDKKHFPKIVVRILAADSFPHCSSKVEARFLYEDDINRHGIKNHTVTAETMERVPVCAEFESNSKKKATVSFQSGKKKKCAEAAFINLQFKGKFQRPENTNSKQVHEEKYRILFTTEINDQKLWTLSLPLVVTTGANQGCLCQASVMWQCFSTNVYTVPIETVTHLPWSRVQEMLQSKMRKLCDTRPLNEDNLNHLKRRLFGKDVGPDEMVTLKMFCFDKMVKTYGYEDDLLTFSFWKWFIGVYNLIDRYLLKFWEENLIYGFVSKEDGKERLKHSSSGRSGTFILRFSDQNITDSQGVKSVFAHLTATVFMIKEVVDGRKKKSVYDIDVAGHSKLKIKNLANILMETVEKKNGTKIYQYVYPGLKKREDTFDKHIDEETVVAGYNGTRDGFIIDLEHAMSALDIDTGKHTRSPSIDSGFARSPQYSEHSAAPVKRQRASMDHPTIASMLNTENLYARSPVSSPAYSMQGSCNGKSPAYSLSESPNLGNQSPQSTIHNQPSPMLSDYNCSSVSQDTVYPSLPTVISDMDNQSEQFSTQNLNQFGSMNSKKRSSPVQQERGCGIYGGTPPEGCESGQGCCSLSDDGSSLSTEEVQIEVMVSNDDNMHLPCEGGNAPIMFSVQKDGSMLKIVPGDSLQQQIGVSANQNPENQLLLNNNTTNQGALNASPDQLAHMLSLLLNNLPVEQRLQYLQQLTVGMNQVGTEAYPTITTQQQNVGVNPGVVSYPNVTSQPTNTTANNPGDSLADMIISSCSTNTMDTPTLTSAGSVGEAFDFSSSDIAEVKDMNSGNIDISMFNMTSSGSINNPGENMSSGSSFEIGGT